MPALPDREEDDDEDDSAVEHLIVVEGHAPSTTTTTATTTGYQQQQQQPTRCSCCFDAAYHDPLLPCTCSPSPSCDEDEDDENEDEDGDEDEDDDDDDEEAMDVEGEEEEKEKEEEEEHMDTTAVAVVEKKMEEEEDDEKVEKMVEVLLSCLVMRCNVSCHACKVLQPRSWVCPRTPGHRWCERCLANRFGVAFDDAPAWPGLATARGCPACRGHCPCAACRRRSGQPHPNRAGRPRRTTTTTTATTAAAKAKAAQCEGGGGGERRERGFVRLAMHEDPAAGHQHDHDHDDDGHHEENWTKVLDRDAFRSSLVFRKSFLSPAEGERLVEVLRGCEDQMRYHRFVVMGSKKTAHLEPRATLCFGATVAYHGVSVVTRPWSKAPPELIALKKKMMEELNVEVNSFLCTRYLNGLQYIGKHADDQANVKDGRVVTVSLGAERDFCFEDRGAGKKWVVSLPHRSLYIMEGDFQKHLEHWIPAAPEVKSERWSITARFLMNTDGSRTTTVEPPGCLTVAERDPFWIAKALRKKQPSFFGHPPQVPVGHVFESFPPVMETGLHPTHVQAMAGTSKEGVRSMKMGRERSLVNMDRLDSIVCFTNGTHSRRGGQPDIDATFSNERNKPWLTSMLSNKPIRVVVSSSTTSPFAPPCGPDGGDKWHYRGLFTCRGAYVVEVAGLYRIYVSLEALSPEHSYRPPPLEHGVVEDCDGKESDDDGDGNEGDDDDDDGGGGQKGGAGRKRKRSRGGTTAKKKKKKKQKKKKKKKKAAALEDDVEVEVDDDDNGDDDDDGDDDDGVDDAIEVDFPPSRPPAVDGAGPQAEADAAEAAPCWCWGRESAVAAHVMFGTPPAAANLDLDHRLGYVLAVDEEERLASDSFAGLPLFQLHAYLIRHRSAHLSDRLALPELLAYLNSLPLFQLRERAVAVHARLRAEPSGRPRIADYLCGLDDLTPAHVGFREPEQGLPCYFLTNACLFDESGGMVSLERVRPGAGASVVGRVAGGHPSAADDAWVLAAPASTLHLDYGLSGLWLRVARPFRAWLRVVSGSELYAPLFVSTLGKARMAYAAHDHIRRLPPGVRARVTFRWLVKKLRGAYAEADIASAAAFLSDHLEEEHPGVPCIDHLRTLPRPPEPEPRARAMLVPHWADTAHRLAWVAQQMPRNVAIEPRLGLYTEPPAEREGKRKADPKPPPTPAPGDSKPPPGEPARTRSPKSSPRRRRTAAADASRPPLPAHDTTRTH